MRAIIAGSRDINDYALLEKAIDESGFDISEVVSGGANGVDKLGERWARERGIPVKKFPAEWDKYGRAAGPIRNGEMAQYAKQDYGALIALTTGGPGTTNVISHAREAGLKTHVVHVRQQAG